VYAACSGLQAGVRGHPRPAWLGGGGLLGPAKCGRTPSRPPVLYTSRPQLDGKCTLIRKSQHSNPWYGARTGGAQRSSWAPYYGAATHISPRFWKKSPYYGVGANRWACSEDTNADCLLWNGERVSCSKYMCASLHFESILSWRPGKIGLYDSAEAHLKLFPGLEDRVLSKCSDAHIYLDQGTCSPFERWQSAFVSSGIWGRVSVGRVAMTLKANRVTWLRRTVLPQGSQGPNGACPPAPAHRPELRPATARSDFRGSKRPRWPAGDRDCAPTSVAAARRRFLTPSSGAVRGTPSRDGRSHPPARALSRRRAGGLRGGVTAPPVGVAPRRRVAAAAVAAAAPLSPPNAPPATATWLYVPPRALAAMQPAGVPGVDAPPSAPPA